MRKLKFLFASMLLIAILSVPFTVLAASPSSANQAFGGNFDSSFTNDTAGWLEVAGTWVLSPRDPGYYGTGGVPGLWSSIKHIGTYRALTYQVRMKRIGCNTCTNAIIIRGNPSNLGADKDWKAGYWFQYSRDGYFSIWKGVNGNYTALKPWTYTTALFKGSHVNTLKVVANGTALKFYINNTLVWHGIDSSLSTGQVGVEEYRRSAGAAPNGGGGDGLYVDWAHMTVPEQNTPNDYGDESVAPGVEISGGDRHQSP